MIGNVSPHPLWRQRQSPALPTLLLLGCFPYLLLSTQFVPTVAGEVSPEETGHVLVGKRTSTSASARTLYEPRARKDSSNKEHLAASQAAMLHAYLPLGRSDHSEEGTSSDGGNPTKSQTLAHEARNGYIPQARTEFSKKGPKQTLAPIDDDGSPLDSPTIPTLLLLQPQTMIHMLTPSPSPTQLQTLTQPQMPAQEPTLPLTQPMTLKPTLPPTQTQTLESSPSPTQSQTLESTLLPTQPQTLTPTQMLTQLPSLAPTLQLTQPPTLKLTLAPTLSPTFSSNFLQQTFSPARSEAPSPDEDNSGSPTGSPTSTLFPSAKSASFRHLFSLRKFVRHQRTTENNDPEI